MLFHMPGLTTSVLLIAISSLSSSIAIGADNYPSRPIKLIVGASPGGTTDTMARAICSFGSAADNDIDIEPDVLGCDLGGPLAATLRPVIFDCDGATFDPAEFAQPLHKRGGCRRA